MSTLGKLPPSTQKDHLHYGKLKVELNPRLRLSYSLVIEDSLSCKWEPFPIFFDMTPGGLQCRLFVECYDWDPDGSFDLIGEFRCTLGEFVDSKRKHYFINPRKKKYVIFLIFSLVADMVSPFYKNSGSFVLYSATPLNARPPVYAPCAGYTFTFCCKNLARKDLSTLSSDPFLVIRAKSSGGGAGLTQQIATMTLGKLSYQPKAFLSHRPS